MSPRSVLPARLYQREVVNGMVPISAVRLIGHYLQVKGVPPAEVLPSIWPLPSSRDLARFPAEDYCQALIRVAERLQDPLLGLHLGQTLRPAHLGPLGYVLLACENLGAALIRLVRYHRLLHDINPVEHRVVDDQLELRWGIAHGKPGALFDEVGLVSLTECARGLCGQRLPVTAVDFVNPLPPDVRPYTDYFGCPVRFAQPVTRLVLPLAYLALPLRQPDPALLRLMEDQVDEVLARLPSPGDLGELTRRLIQQMACQGMPELAQVARELRSSPRILYRQLAAQGLNFRALREAALRELAQTHLSDERLTLAEVGMLTGYSEQSAFCRAFKRWTGLSPMAWRQQHGRAEMPPHP